jgi:hypothetical protein
MPFESYPEPTDPAERFDRIMRSLQRAVADNHVARGVSGPLVLLIWNFLGGIINRFAAIVAKLRTGTLPAPRSPRPRAPKPRAPFPAAESPAPAKPPRKKRLLPNAEMWLVKLLGWHVGGLGSQLEHLLKDPDMAALIAAAPQLGRLLRPLCRALGRDPGAAKRGPPPPPPPPNPKKKKKKRNT